MALSVRAHSYTCRYFRTKRIEIRFMMSVSTNSSMPTAKIVLYSVLPVGDVALGRGADERGERVVRVARVERVAGDLAGGDEHDHRLADRPRDAEHDGRHDPGEGGREHDPQGDVELRGAEPEGALAERLRAPTDIASSATEATVGTIMKPMTMPAASTLKMLTFDAEEVAQDLRREEREREVAEDDRRHAREDLEHGLDRLAHARARVLAEVDRGAEPERGGHHHRDARGEEACPTTQRDERRSWAARTAASTCCPRGTPRRRRRRRTRSSAPAARSRSPWW